MRLGAQTRRAFALGAVAASGALGAAALAASPAGAQGFGLNEIGTCAIGRGFAVVGAPCEDASVLYWNPGAAARMPQGLSVYGGVSAVQVQGSFTADYTRQRYDGDVPIELPPFLGATWKGAGRLSLGLAAYVPYGLTSQWQDDFIGRFAAQKASLQTIYVQPNVAFEVVPGRLSIGGGPTIGHSSLELRQALDFAEQQVPGQPTGTTFARLGFARGTEFGNARIEGSGWGVGFNVGAHLQMTEKLSLGVRYLSPVTFDYEGDATFTQSARAGDYVLRTGNPLNLPAGTTLTQVTAANFAAGGALAPGQEVESSITHPGQVQVGLGWKSKSNSFGVDYALIQWSSFDELPVNFVARGGGAASPPNRVLYEDYEASHSIRVGGEHRYPSGIAARAGASYATTPAPDVTVTPLLPDMDRFNFNLGAALPLGSRYVLDLGYLRVETEGRRGRTGDRPDRRQTADQLNNGWYALNANIFSVSLKARF